MENKKIHKLTPEQNKVWEDVFSNAINEGFSEEQADDEAFIEVKKAFPELKNYRAFI